MSDKPNKKRIRKHRKTIRGKPISTGESDVLANHHRAFKKTTPVHGNSVRAGETYPQLDFPHREDMYRIGVDVRVRNDTPYVLIWDKDLRKELGDVGIFSRNIGSGVRRDRDFYKSDDISAISMYDLLFAFQLGIVDTNYSNRNAAYDGLITAATANDPDFLDKFSVYLDLRRKGLIVMDGENYGTDFVVYTDSPEKFRSRNRGHSTALVDVTNGADMRLPEAIKGEQLAKSINKEYYLVSASGDRDDDHHLYGLSANITYQVLNTDVIGIDSSADINAQIAKRLGDEHVVPWELRRRY